MYDNDLWYYDSFVVKSKSSETIEIEFPNSINSLKLEITNGNDELFLHIK